MSLLIADPALRMYCVNGVCYLHHPIKQKSYNLKVLDNKPLKKLMRYLEKPKSITDVNNFVSMMLNVRYEQAVSHIDTLCRTGFIKKLKNITESNESWEVNNWGEAGVFHQHTAETPRISYANKMGNIYDIAMMENYVKEKTPPKNFKEYSGPRVVLDKPTIDETISIKNILDSKKTGTMIDVKKLGRLLYFAFGKTGYREMQVTGKHIRKTVPSGGSRHPYEFYLLIHQIEGIDPGIYHYQFNDHYLTLLRRLEKSEIRMIIDKNLIIDSRRLNFIPQFAIVYSCVFERGMYRYRYSRSYRVMLYDLGHIYQNLDFIVRAYGLNMYSGYSCHERKVEELIGFDSVSESCMGYAVL